MSDPNQFEPMAFQAITIDDNEARLLAEYAMPPAQDPIKLFCIPSHLLDVAEGGSYQGYQR